MDVRSALNSSLSTESDAGGTTTNVVVVSVVLLRFSHN